MWGRLGMNTNRTCYKLIKTSEEWFTMIRDEQNIIHHADFSHKDIIQVYYSNRYDIGSSETSVVHAAFVTAHARLKLYSELEKLNQRVLYFDTDSIIYIWKSDEYNPTLGNYLGDLTNELDEDDYIEEFISAGPKNYGYRTLNGKTKCTVKGFRLNDKTKKIINFDSIKNIVFNDRLRKIEADQIQFTRNKKNWTVKSEIYKKKYSFVYNKRVVLDDLNTLPYGYYQN